MDTRPDIPETRSARGWRPFGDAIPMPARRRAPSRLTREPAAGGDRAARARRFPLWLPLLVALIIGAVAALVALAVKDDPARDGVGATPVLVRDTGATAELEVRRSVVAPQSRFGEAGPTYSWSDAPSAAPRRPPNRARAAPGRAFAPRRVSDLKANPYVVARHVRPGRARPWHPRKVSDLKANPFSE